MKYYKYPNPDITDDEIATEYIEVNGDIVMRQLSVFKDWYISSNVDLALADQPFDAEILTFDAYEIVPIIADEFNMVWQKHLQHHEAKWNDTKKAFQLKRQVIGCMKIFFPQGIIVQLGQQIFGVADYREARATVDTGFIMGTGYQISAIVTGYDEINQWVELASPRIFSNKRCDPSLWHTPV